MDGRTDHVSVAHKILSLIYTVALLGQEFHKTGPDVQIARQIEHVRKELAAQRQLEYCGRVDCPPHPDSLLTCRRAPSWKADCLAGSPSPDCQLPLRNECLYPSEDCQFPFPTPTAAPQTVEQTQCETLSTGDKVKLTSFVVDLLAHKDNRIGKPDGEDLGNWKWHPLTVQPKSRVMELQEGMSGKIIRTVHSNGRCGVVVSVIGTAEQTGPIPDHCDVPSPPYRSSKHCRIVAFQPWRSECQRVWKLAPLDVGTAERWQQEFRKEKVLNFELFVPNRDVHHLTKMNAVEAAQAVISTTPNHPYLSTPPPCTQCPATPHPASEPIICQCDPLLQAQSSFRSLLRQLTDGQLTGPLNTGDEVEVTRPLYNGPPELRSTQGVDQGVTGTIIRWGDRDGQCGVWINVRGFWHPYVNLMVTRDNLLSQYPHALLPRMMQNVEVFVPTEAIQNHLVTYTHPDSTHNILQTHSDSTYNILQTHPDSSYKILQTHPESTYNIL